jgi:hypothetical protein
MSFAYRVCMSAMVDMSVAPCEQESSDLTDGPSLRVGDDLADLVGITRASGLSLDQVLLIGLDASVACTP